MPEEANAFIHHLSIVASLIQILGGQCHPSILSCNTQVGIFFDPAAREDFEHLNQRLFVDHEFHLYIPASKGRLKYPNTALVRSKIWRSLIPARSHISFIGTKPPLMNCTTSKGLICT